MRGVLHGYGVRMCAVVAMMAAAAAAAIAATTAGAVLVAVSSKISAPAAVPHGSNRTSWSELLMLMGS